MQHLHQYCVDLGMPSGFPGCHSGCISPSWRAKPILHHWCLSERVLLPPSPHLPVAPCSAWNPALCQLFHIPFQQLASPSASFRVGAYRLVSKYVLSVGHTGMLPSGSCRRPSLRPPATPQSAQGHPGHHSLGLKIRDLGRSTQSPCLALPPTSLVIVDKPLKKHPASVSSSVEE